MEDIDYLQSLPIDILIEILKTETPNDILNVCMSSKALNTKICDNDDFWKRKSSFDKNNCNKPSSISWKEYYKNLHDVFSFGFNSYGQLCLKDIIDRNIPISLHFKARSIACGENFTMLIDLNDNVWAFGYNYFGQLGLGDNLHRNTPTPLQFKTSVFETSFFKATSIVCGQYHTILIDLNGDVWVFGSNYYGQLGVGDNLYRNIPTPLNVKARSMDAGEYHTVFIDLNDDVWVFGSNYYGQLGLEDCQNRNIPTPLHFKATFVACGWRYTLLLT